MSFSIYSFLNAVFWFNVILIPIAILQLRGNAAKHYSPVLLAALAILAAVRVFLPVDSSMFLVIRSYHVLRFLQQVLTYRVFDLVPVWEVAVMIWIAGALTVFIREMYLCQRDRRTRQSWVHVHNERVVCAATALEIPLERIVVTPKVGVPMAAGLFHPQIYLPDADLTIEEWTWVLKHEQMHLKKGDIWFKLLYLVLEGLFFWNPLMPMRSGPISWQSSIFYSMQKQRKKQRNGPVNLILTCARSWWPMMQSVFCGIGWMRWKTHGRNVRFCILPLR